MTSSASSILVIGQGPVADAVADRLQGQGPVVVAPTPGAAAEAGLPERVAALVVVLPPPPPLALFEAIDDERLETQLTGFSDLFACLGQVLERLDQGGAVLLIGDRGYLGAWGAADACAFSGAYAALMRCVVLEGFSAGHRANTIALDRTEDGALPDAAAIARLAAQLVAPEGEAINGAIILANHGRSLRLREARNRRAALAAPTQGSPS